MATPNCPGKRRRSREIPRGPRGAFIAPSACWCLGLVGLLAAGWHGPPVLFGPDVVAHSLQTPERDARRSRLVWAKDPSPRTGSYSGHAVVGCGEENSTFAKRAEQNYREARTRFQSNTNNAEAAWQFGRACFDRADFARNDEERESIANEGIAACRQLLERDSKSAPGHYYLAMNLGQLAQTKTLGALKLVEEMEREFKTSRELDPKWDYAGPDRNLGLLYFEAPGWPASIGNKSNARRHLERCVELAPHYPENRLCLLEALLKWKDKKSALRELQAVRQLLPGARKEFTGEAWEQSWADWDKRWEKIQEKARQFRK